MRGAGSFVPDHAGESLLLNPSKPPSAYELVIGPKFSEGNPLVCPTAARFVVGLGMYAGAHEYASPLHLHATNDDRSVSLDTGRCLLAALPS